MAKGRLELAVAFDPVFSGVEGDWRAEWPFPLRLGFSPSYC